LVAAVVCPHPPLLLPELWPGAGGRLDALRSACDRALRIGLDAAPERVVIVGGATSTGRWEPETARGSGVFGVPDSPSGLPLSLAVGEFLLARSGWVGCRELTSIAVDASPAECSSLGADIADGPSTLLLVMGDGSGVRREAPPGSADPAAEPFDANVVAALVAADVHALLGIDPVAATALKAAGRAAWQVLAGAAGVGSRRWSATLHHDEAPYGVGYFVASWLPVR
jgi:hypothetical protein